jgi:hypothetical protein
VALKGGMPLAPSQARIRRRATRRATLQSTGLAVCRCCSAVPKSAEAVFPCRCVGLIAQLRWLPTFHRKRQADVCRRTHLHHPARLASRLAAARQSARQASRNSCDLPMR